MALQVGCEVNCECGDSMDGRDCQLCETQEKLRIATECLKDVRSELTHAKHNIDEQWCIDQICAALERIATNGSKKLK